MLGCVVAAAAVAFFFYISQLFFSSSQSPDDDDDDRFDVVIRNKNICVYIKKESERLHHDPIFSLLFLLIFHRLPPIPKQATKKKRRAEEVKRAKSALDREVADVTTEQLNANWSNNFNSHHIYSPLQQAHESII